MTPDETRALALAQAVLHSDKALGLAGVIAAATQFAAFIADGTAAAPAKADKPKTEKVKAEPKPEPVKEVAEGPTQEQVSEVIDQMLQANLRKQAVELLGKFKAKNASTLPAEHRAAFIEEAGALLLAG
jgi:hypothetical protein